MTDQTIPSNNEPVVRPINPFNKVYGVDFNPGGNLMVHTIKRTFADLTEMLDKYLIESDSDVPQFVYHNMLGECMKAQMMMVKVATWK